MTETDLRIRHRILDAAFKLAFGTREEQALGLERIPKLLEELKRVPKQTSSEGKSSK